MSKAMLRQAANILALVATLAINGLANALPLNGLTTGEISDRFEVFFVPAGYVFGIWGLIYLGLIAFAVYQALPSQRENPRLERVGYWFVLSCAANIAWLFLWHYEFFVPTVFAMLSLLISLTVVYLRLEIGKTPVSAGERWFVRVPFGIYLGWITVATIANITSTLDYQRWSGWGISPEIWTIIMLAAGVAITAMMIYTRRDAAYSLVIVWAFAGIAVKHATVQSVSLAAWIGAGLVLLLLAAGLFAPRLAPAEVKPQR